MLQETLFGSLFYGCLSCFIKSAVIYSNCIILIFSSISLGDTFILYPFGCSLCKKYSSSPFINSHLLTAITFNCLSSLSLKHPDVNIPKQINDIAILLYIKK